MNKGDITMSNTYVAPKPNQYGPYYEYVMPEGMAKTLLENRIGEEKKMRPHDYLVKVVNEQFGIRGTCVQVSTN